MDNGKLRQEIVDAVISSGLVETCVQYQLNKCKNNFFKEEMVQETYVWLLEYDIEKLQDAYEHRHLNALITRFIINQWFSKTSPFYKKYKKYDLVTDEITEKELQIPDPTSLGNLPENWEGRPRLVENILKNKLNEFCGEDI